MEHTQGTELISRSKGSCDANHWQMPSPGARTCTTMSLSQTATCTLCWKKQGHFLGFQGAWQTEVLGLHKRAEHRQAVCEDGMGLCTLAVSVAVCILSNLFVSLQRAALEGPLQILLTLTTSVGK